ncbi:protein of unknown function [Dysgonomonas macrotermitis]|uniref:DUF3943 domain-containing protein n=2 Tax=Dysgonomonas macrotermitis TaxID=1346286 RepID=A0A1M5AYG5_9BACT|nr:protein of unknown function [Dysgonomonas macrotermitis]
MKKFLPILFLILLSTNTHAQFIMRHKTTRSQPVDSLDLQYYAREKKVWTAATQVFGLNMSVWAFDRYVQQADFAKISMHSIRENLKEGFYWDNDRLGTNMFLHPYHGNLYFNSARSRGFNYWESGAFALGGSAMWELFMENEFPSTNDIIATPIGGMAIGEVFHRGSDMILDDRKRGGERIRREVLAGIVNPMRALTRVINGDAWRVRQTSGRQFGIPDVSIEVSAGIRIIEVQDEIFDKGAGLGTTFSIEYGDRYDGENIKPFDYFTIRGSLNVQASQPLLGQLNIIGRLWAAELLDTKKDYFNIGIYQHFDYYDSDTISNVSNEIPYKMATPAAFGVGLIHKSKRFKDWDFNSYLHINGILLGASLSDHYRVSERNYNLASGFGWKTGVNISYKDKVGVAWIYEGYRLFTWKGYPEGTDLATVDYDNLDAQGDNSNATFNTTSLKIDLKLKDQWYLTAVGTYFRRSTHYRYFDDVYSKSGEGKLMLTYKF